MAAKRILFVVNAAWFFVSHRLHLAIAARNEGYDIHIAATKDKSVVNIEQTGLTFHDIPFSRKRLNPVTELITIFKLLVLYIRINPDLVHHVTIKPVIYGSFVAKLINITAIVNAISGLGYVFTTKGFIASIRKNLVICMYRMLTNGNNAWVIFQNKEDKLLFETKNLVKMNQSILIKGSGVDLNNFTVSPEYPGVPKIVLAARMLWDKGVGDFVDAAKLLLNRGFNARFILAGSPDNGNPNSISHNKLKEWSLVENIEWVGYCSDMPQLYASAHVVCLPSYYGEGVPKTLIEAAACGRPIVTTDMPGCREIVVDGKNGLLVPIRNSIALADALERLIKNPNIRYCMGINGRKLVEYEFSTDKVVSQTLFVYRELLN